MDEATLTLEDDLLRWARRHFVDPAILDLRDLGGHSGETWAFACEHAAGRTELVLRLAARGNDDAANAELVRQGTLLSAMKASGIKVAGVRDASAETDLFGRGYIIVDMLAGRPLIMGPEGGTPWLSAKDRDAAYLAAARELARINGVPVESLAGWAAVRGPVEEIELWAPAMARAADPAWAEEGARLADALRQSAPDAFTAAVCHGDFQTNNVLFEASPGAIEVGGVVDWEIAHFGAAELDLAWFMMMNDPHAWDAVEQRGNVDLVAVQAAYEDERGAALRDLSWYRALAGYKIAAIAGYKIRLHRKRYKHDEAWERASSSLPVFFSRAYAMLENAA